MTNREIAETLQLSVREVEECLRDLSGKARGE